MDNPLASAAPTMQIQQGQQQPAPNPLAGQGGQQAPQDPQAAIAAMNLSPADLAHHAQLSTYVAQELGNLARKPDLKPKDVVNASGQAVADGQITAPDAVKFLASMPQDEKDLRAWVAQQYGMHLTAAVHLKAALMRGAANVR